MDSKEDFRKKSSELPTMYDPYDFLGQGVKSGKDWKNSENKAKDKSFAIKERNDDSL